VAKSTSPGHEITTPQGILQVAPREYGVTSVKKNSKRGWRAAGGELVRVTQEFRNVPLRNNFSGTRARFARIFGIGFSAGPAWGKVCPRSGIAKELSEFPFYSSGFFLVKYFFSFS
jgi:hypothetical protein